MEVLCQPGIQRLLPTRAVSPYWQQWAPLELLSKEQNSEGAEPGRRRSAWGGVCWPECKEIPERTHSAPREPRWAGWDVRHGKREGVAGPAPVRTSGGARGRGSGQLSLLWSRASHLEPFLARSPARPAQGHPHLVNRTVPCSSGLRFTACQLCRISSGSGRSMLALLGRRAQGWNPRGARPSLQVPCHVRSDEATPHPW